MFRGSRVDFFHLFTLHVRSPITANRCSPTAYALATKCASPPTCATIRFSSPLTASGRKAVWRSGRRAISKRKSRLPERRIARQPSLAVTTARRNSADTPYASRPRPPPHLHHRTARTFRCTCLAVRAPQVATRSCVFRFLSAHTINQHKHAAQASEPFQPSQQQRARE